jgi:hypothetical protein
VAEDAPVLLQPSQTCHCGGSGVWTVALFIVELIIWNGARSCAEHINHLAHIIFHVLEVELGRAECCNVEKTTKSGEHRETSKSVC